MRKTSLTLLLTSMAMAAPTADQLIAKVNLAQIKSAGKFALDDGGKESVQIKAYNGAAVWTADMDIDCDGIETAACNAKTDPSFWNQTALAINGDNGETYLDASKIPYIVVPGVSTRYDAGNDSLILGNVAAVIYGGKVGYAIYGDVGPVNIIGEASYALAQSMGISPNPANGGVDAASVSYVLFKGENATVSDPTNLAEIKALGEKLASDWVGASTATASAPQLLQIHADRLQTRIGGNLKFLDGAGKLVRSWISESPITADLGQLEKGLAIIVFEPAQGTREIRFWFND